MCITHPECEVASYSLYRTCLAGVVTDHTHSRRKKAWLKSFHTRPVDLLLCNNPEFSIALDGSIHAYFSKYYFSACLNSTSRFLGHTADILATWTELAEWCCWIMSGYFTLCWSTSRNSNGEVPWDSEHFTRVIGPKRCGNNRLFSELLHSFLSSWKEAKYEIHTVSNCLYVYIVYALWKYDGAQHEM